MVSRMGNRIVKASEFKARCLKLMDEVAATGETIIVTKHGRPVAELRPVERPRRGFFGRDHGKIVIHGDLEGLPCRSRRRRGVPRSWSKVCGSFPSPPRRC